MRFDTKFDIPETRSGKLTASDGTNRANRICTWGEGGDLNVNILYLSTKERRSTIF